MRSLACLLFLSSFLLGAITVTPRALAGRQAVSKDILQDGTPIQNPNDPHVVNIAQAAVSAYNARVQANFSFIRVLYGDTLVTAAGTKYGLRIEATNSNGQVVNCTAIMLEVAADQPLQFIGFVPYEI